MEGASLSEGRSEVRGRLQQLLIGAAGSRRGRALFAGSVAAVVCAVLWWWRRKRRVALAPASDGKLPAVLDRRRFGLSERGFLPSRRGALQELPAEFSLWDDVARRLPELVKTGNICELIDRWPKLDARLLDDGSDDFSPALRRAYCVLAMIAHGYVWCDASNPQRKLPRAVSVPLQATASRLGVPPVLTHAAVNLWNWKGGSSSPTADSAGGASAAASSSRAPWPIPLVAAWLGLSRRADAKANDVPADPLPLDGIRCLTTMTGKRDEEWFYSAVTASEALAGPVVLTAYDVFAKAVPAGDAAFIRKFLADCSACLEDVAAVFRRVPEHCRAEVFCGEIRPLLQGFGAKTPMRGGLIYEGVAEYGGLARAFSGVSGSQSSFLPVFDAVLGVCHCRPAQTFLKENRRYMPRRHREFVDLLQAQTSLRQVLMQWRDGADAPEACGAAVVEDLIGQFNACIDKLVEFRKGHGSFAESHLAPEASAQAKSGEGPVAGAVDEEVLNAMLDATEAAKISIST